MKDTELTDENIIDVSKKCFNDGVERTADELKLFLLETLVKTSCGYRNGYTEELFLGKFNLLKKDRTPNIKGRRFIMQMLYAPSCRRPPIYNIIKEYRR